MYPDLEVSEALLGMPAEPIVRCLVAENDGAELCRSVAPHDNYEGIVYPGQDHGMALLTPGRTPDVGQVILEFLLLSLNLAE